MTAATCHPDRPVDSRWASRGLCQRCRQAEDRRRAGARPSPRGRCPGCNRDDVVLLSPTATKPWRRKDHAIEGDLNKPGTPRCRHPRILTPDEIPTEDP